jgi:ribose 1,5-bisphosphokinase
LPDALQPTQTRGSLIAIVGPSGAGKDSLIAYARRRLGRDPVFMFVRRVVTRADGGTEDHDCMNPEAFEAARSRGAFAVTWDAHGLSYGIPHSARAHMDTGGIAIINGSRAALPDIAKCFEAVSVVNITAEPDILARRLAARRREDGDQVAMRLARTIHDFAQHHRVFDIDNSGTLEDAGEKLVIFLERQCARRIAAPSRT